LFWLTFWWLCRQELRRRRAFELRELEANVAIDSGERKPEELQVTWPTHTLVGLFAEAVRGIAGKNLWIVGLAPASR
jgi:hypothetical protein